MGTAGSTLDGTVALITFGAGTAVVDNGTIRVAVVFRSVGSGTSAVVATNAEIRHKGNAVGLTTTGGNSYAQIVGVSAGFNSTTPTNIGVSFSGGTSFSGTNTVAFATLNQ
jgi:hypothetical protein